MEIIQSVEDADSNVIPDFFKSSFVTDRYLTNQNLADIEHIVAMASALALTCPESSTQQMFYRSLSRAIDRLSSSISWHIRGFYRDYRTGELKSVST